MANKGKSGGRKSGRPQNGLGDFNASRINQHSVVNDFIRPVAVGLVGAAAGHFAGKGKNLLLAGAAGLAAIAAGYGEEVMPAVVGCAVVTPPAATTATTTGTTGIDGLDGLKDFVSGGANRSKGYAKSFLSNLGLQSVADKISVNGFDGLGDADVQSIYDQGYMAGVGDIAAIEDGSDYSTNEVPMTMNGYMLAEGASKPRSMAAAIASGMGL